MVLVEGCAAQLLGTGDGFAETLTAQQCFPIHYVLRSEAIEYVAMPSGCQGCGPGGNRVEWPPIDLILPVLEHCMTISLTLFGTTACHLCEECLQLTRPLEGNGVVVRQVDITEDPALMAQDRKSTRLNSSHVRIS